METPSKGLSKRRIVAQLPHLTGITLLEVILVVCILAVLGAMLLR